MWERQACASSCKKGYQTTGVDLSEESINKAKEHAIENANFEVHDMRKTFIEKEFDYVFNLFTSFGYFEADEENLKVLKAAAANLKPEGIFVLDFLNVKKVIPNHCKRRENNRWHRFYNQQNF